MFLTSGMSPVQTSDDTPVQLLDVASGFYTCLVVSNTGSAPGFIAIGLTAPTDPSRWLYVPEMATIGLRGLQVSSPTKVWLRRVTGGGNVTGVYASMY